MSITSKFANALDQVKSLGEEKAKLEAVAAELKEKLTAVEQAHAAEIVKLAEQAKKLDGEISAAKADIEKQLATKAELEKSVAARDEQIKALEAKLKLAAFADVAEGAKPVADGGTEASAPVSHLAELNKLGQFTPQGVAYYRKHEKEINAEVAASLKK